MKYPEKDLTFLVDRAFTYCFVFQLARLARGDRSARFSVNDEGCQKINKRKREQVQINRQHKYFSKTFRKHVPRTELYFAVL